AGWHTRPRLASARLLRRSTLGPERNRPRRMADYRGYHFFGGSGFAGTPVPGCGGRWPGPGFLVSGGSDVPRPLWISGLLSHGLLLARGRERTGRARGRARHRGRAPARRRAP